MESGLDRYGSKSKLPHGCEESEMVAKSLKERRKNTRKCKIERLAKREGGRIVRVSE